MLFSDESKFNRALSDEIRYVKRRKSEDFNPGCTVGTIKHSNVNVMVWESFSRNNPESNRKINDIVKKYKYLEIMKGTMIP